MSRVHHFADPLIAKAVNEVLVERLMADVFLDKPLSPRIRKNFNTACWTFANNEHLIFIGDQVLPFDRERPDLTDKDHIRFYKALMHHELAHAEHTVRNFPAMNSMCEAAGADFSLLNLMEDARIEHVHRQVMGTKFDWSSFYTEPVDDGGQPVTLLYKMVEAESPDVECADPKMLARVQDYYARIVACPSTMNLRPILKEWVEEFSKEQTPDRQKANRGQGQGEPGGQGGKGSKPKNGKGQEKDGNVLSERGELQTAAQLARDEKALEQALADSKDVKDIAMPGGRGKGAPDETKGKFLDRPQDINPKEVEKIAALLEKMMVSNERLVSTTDPTTRLNRRAIVDPNQPAYRRKELPKKKKLKLVMVVDCSGSMDGEPAKAATTMAAALHLLALKGHVEGQLITSTTEKFEVYDFKDEKGVLNCFARPSAEGLERTFEANQKLLRDADATLVFTDAALADTPINKARWHAKGITTTGLYVGPVDALANLQKYFDRSLIRSNVTDLAFALQKNFARQVRPGMSR
ncbi:hypothetical protein [Ramlibacter alkalitolerans]|uniref:VWA domain-containing protein n=1 Tax=Ramlibacter alkalitolerans TaxID=2039631 RepID=A0ABS1JU87_9BURK|nr:hypothetical protein [Ramlibacter alkalitolerans]MBL0427824.1 hypothetical protein [Ramlibacter alkalitolerans]